MISAANDARVPEPLMEATAALTAELGERAHVDAPLGARTTYRVGGTAAVFVDAHSVNDLVVVAQVIQRFERPVIVIGRGSNMLVSDGGFAGVAVSLSGLADQIDLPAVGGARGGLDEPRVVVAGGAVELPRLSRQTAAAGLTGFEWAVGVPGSVGGAVRMNAGGHGSDMAACLIDFDAFSFAATDHSAPTRRVRAEEIALRFRASSLDPDAVVLRARLRLRTGDAGAAKREIAEIVKWRREHQPGGQNCGSVFVNPVPGEVTAGGLIDGLGLRGFRIGSAWVSEKHANFVLAEPAGRADDVRAVIEEVRARVSEATGFRLRSEVRLVGFDDADPLSFEEASPPVTRPPQVLP